MRAHIAEQLLEQMRAGSVEALIARAPEFYGPGNTKSLTNTAVFDRIAAGRRPIIPISARTRRSLIWTPDASRAMALLGNTPDAFGRTWHLPIDPHLTTYADIVAIAEEVTGRTIRYAVLPEWAFRLAGRFNPEVKESLELMPRYRQDNLFDASAFAKRFPEFAVTTYRDGIGELLGRG